MDNNYFNLPYDLSGSMSKNRFRNEMLWGLEKMFELYKANVNFLMVFDYMCDVEVHLDGGIEFYQLKTNSATNPYSISRIAKPDKVGKSILGKLYAIKVADDSENGIVNKMAIVVNVSLKTEDKVIHAFDYEIAGEYEDAGKSGKSIAGRAVFKRMLEDIESGKDDGVKAVEQILMFCARKINGGIHMA